MSAGYLTVKETSDHFHCSCTPDSDVSFLLMCRGMSRVSEQSHLANTNCRKDAIERHKRKIRPAQTCRTECRYIKAASESSPLSNS